VTTETKVEAVARLEITAHGRGEWSAHESTEGMFVLYAQHASAITALEGEVAMLRDALHIETHKVITCGVAASHPDASLSRRMEYSGKWDSPQAQQVRALREDRDAAERRATDLEYELAKLRDEWQASLGWKGAVVHGTRANIGVISAALTKESP
jgi:hypothetical protein